MWMSSKALCKMRKTKFYKESGINSFSVKTFIWAFVFDFENLLKMENNRKVERMKWIKCNFSIFMIHILHDFFSVQNLYKFSTKKWTPHGGK